MSAPAVAFHTWILAAVDPVLILVAAYLGWKADQAGKVFIAAIVALATALLADWLLASVGLPSAAPVAQNGPTLIPVRAIGGLIWAALAYAAHRVRRRGSTG